MKTGIISILLSILFFTASAQVLHPVKWSYGTKKIGPDTYELHFKADMEDGWHIYSQKQPGNAVADPTKIVLNKSAAFSTVGKPKELGKMEKFYNKDVGIGANQYANTVDFVQVIKVKDQTLSSITGKISFQACTNKKCLPTEDVPFTIPIK
jgi:thiol:disulfide interchange protein DsbD